MLLVISGFCASEEGKQMETQETGSDLCSVCCCLDCFLLFPFLRSLCLRFFFFSLSVVLAVVPWLCFCGSASLLPSSSFPSVNSHSSPPQGVAFTRLLLPFFYSCLSFTSLYGLLTYNLYYYYYYLLSSLLRSELPPAKVSLDRISGVAPTTKTGWPRTMAFVSF